MQHSFRSFGYVPSHFSTQFPISVKEFLRLFKKYSLKNLCSSYKNIQNIIKKLLNDF